MVANEHIYLINRDGMAKQVQVLNEYHQTQVSKISWSPDGRYLAFWNFSDLTIYDSQTDQLINPCVTNEYPDFPIWSINSQQLVVNEYLDEGGILVNLKDNLVYKLMKIANINYPLGWMNSMP